MIGTTPAYLGDAYARKDDGYYANARFDYVAALPRDTDARVLEIGCGSGATGAACLRDGKCGIFVGVEMFEPAARIAEAKLTAVHVGNAETMALSYPEGYFDAVIFSEVLEHLVDPAETLKRTVRLLKPGGRVFASSPNIAHWQSITRIAAGHFDYTDGGVMDRTHLRWFTPSTFRAMFEECGVEVTLLGGIEDTSRAKSAKKLIRALMGKRLAHLGWKGINLHGRRLPELTV